MNIFNILIKKKFTILTVSILLYVIFAIYRSSTIEFHNTDLLRFIRSNFTERRNSYLIEPSNKSCTGEVLFVILVTSYVGHVELRSAHRRAMPVTLLERYNARRIFTLARVPSHEKYITQEAIKDESNIYGDILQGTFTEHYRNLTYKNLMGLKWASTKCSEATFILKVDDDTVFNFKRTYEMVKSLMYLKEQDFLMGYMLNNSKPSRLKQDKWYVTREEYPRDVYPSYLSGWYYITTPKTALRLYTESSHHRYFWIEDVLITGILTESLKIKLWHLPSYYWLEYYELLECCLRDMISKFISCDYVVGPNGGRNNLIVDANEAWVRSDAAKNCTKRPANQDLNKVCVAFRQRTIFSDGRGVAESIKL